MNKLLNLFQRIDRMIIAFIKPLIVILSLLIACGFALGIFMRSVLNSPMFGLEEVILFSVMWLYMLGAVLASQDRSHLSADFVSVLTRNEIVRQSVSIVATFISLVMALFFVSWSYDLLAWGLKKQQATPVFQIPMYISQGSLFVASIFFVFYLVRDLILDLHKMCTLRNSARHEKQAGQPGSDPDSINTAPQTAK